MRKSAALARIAELEADLSDEQVRAIGLADTIETQQARIAELEAKLAHHDQVRDHRDHLSRQVVDLTAEVERLNGELEFAKRVGVQHYEDAEMLRRDVVDLTRHVELLVRVGGYGMKHAAPIVRAEWADAVKGVSRRDENNRFVKADS